MDQTLFLLTPRGSRVWLPNKPILGLIFGHIPKRWPAWGSYQPYGRAAPLLGPVWEFVPGRAVAIGGVTVLGPGRPVRCQVCVGLMGGKLGHAACDVFFLPGLPQAGVLRQTDPGRLPRRPAATAGPPLGSHRADVRGRVSFLTKGCWNAMACGWRLFHEESFQVRPRQREGNEFRFPLYFCEFLHVFFTFLCIFFNAFIFNALFFVSYPIIRIFDRF